MPEREPEIDDEEANEILSSIRQLVTQENGGEAGPKPSLAQISRASGRPGIEIPSEPPVSAPAQRREPPISRPPSAVNRPSPPQEPVLQSVPTQPRRAAQAQAALQEEEILPLVDEEELRALVAEIVREELRGDLGARITRNIRSLVRKEIRRIIDEEL